MYLSRRKPKNNGPFLSTIACAWLGWKWITTVLKKFRLNFSSCFRMSSKKSKLIAAFYFIRKFNLIFLLMFKDDVFHV